MECIMYIIQIILISIAFLICIYHIWFNERVIKQLSHYLGLDIQFILKRWWAVWCISQSEENRSKLKDDPEIFDSKNIFKPCTDNPKIIINEKSCDSVSFYGADQKGNSLFIKMNYRGHRIAELILQLIFSDGRVYVLPNYPDKTTIKDINKKWSALGLTIESLEPRQRWRITYNGLLWNRCQGDTFNEDNMEHIRLNFIFIAKSRLLDWPGDWSTYLHADALARESWKNPDWIQKIKLIDYTGFDQWGSTIGQITFKDSTTDVLYLRGLCQRRWGKQDIDQFRRTIAFFGVTRHGAMYYIGVSSTKYSFSQMQFGHLEEARGMVSKIDWTDLKLSDFEKEDTILTNYKIAFKAAGKNYNAIINYTMEDAITHYTDQSNYWTCTTRNLHVQLNDSRGIGLMIVCCPCIGSKQIKVPVSTRIRYLTQPTTSAQSSKYILHFTDKQCQNENIVGGKAYSLAVLASIITDDFIVPQGFCVTSLALERQLQHHKLLQDLINDIIDISCGKKKEDLKIYCEKTVSFIQTILIEEQIKQAILEGLERLEMSRNEKDTCNLYAVRSSAVGEDSEETSAAGQNSTYLGVKNANDVIKCVVKCWASLFSYQSVEYRRQNGLPIKVSMGVCIQKMIDAEAAGVMFTRHPTTGDPSSIIITANYGLGETVVSGTVEPDTLTIHRKLNDTLVMGVSMVGNKKEKMSLKDNIVTRCTVNKEETKTISISDATALRLAKIGLRLESFFRSARDVEWAVVGKRIFLLQARPITTINTWIDFELMHELDSEVPSDVDLLTFANVGEVLPHPISPLSSSTIIKILNLSINAKIKKPNAIYIHMVGMRCALNYFNTSLRDIDKEITMSNKMIDLAVCGRVITTPEVHRVAVEKYGIVSRWRKIYLMYDMLKTALLSDKIVKTAINVFDKYTFNANEFDTPRNLYNIISDKYKAFFLIAQCHNTTSMMNVFYQMIAMSILTKNTDDLTSDHLADIAVLLSSCTNVISTEVPIALSKIAACIRKNNKAEEFSKVEPAKAVDWLKSNCPPAAEKLRAFFDMHGHRCIHELDLFAEPWIFKSDSIINTIQMQAMSFEKNYTSKSLNVQETIASLKTPMSRLAKWFLQQMIPLCRKAVTRREMSKNILVSVVHTLRLAYKHLAVLMVAESYIPDENLIFFLTHQEIGQLLNNHSSLLVRKALRRKKIYQQMAKVEYPEFSIGMPIPEQKFDTSFYEGCTKIEGTSICNGSVLGRACVITDLSEAKDIQRGDILITHCTDIGWSPYFPLLGGIVTELGGLISHGAVVAREYGLPCIVGAKGATQIFQTGDTVLLTGGVGVLQLIEKQNFGSNK